MSAIFQNDDGYVHYALGAVEYTLGQPRPDKYIWAEPMHGTYRQQLCDGGGFRGNTLSWPKTDDDAEAIRILAKWTRAKIYKTRAGFDEFMARADALNGPAIFAELIADVTEALNKRKP